MIFFNHGLKNVIYYISILYLFRLFDPENTFFTGFYLYIFRLVNRWKMVGHDFSIPGYARTTHARYAKASPHIYAIPVAQVHHRQIMGNLFFAYHHLSP